MLIQQTLIQYLLQKKNLCEIFKVLTIWGNINLFIRPQHHDIQVSSKKEWLKERFDDGLVFLKSEQRGKCFIEYIPAENAWNPIVADSYMYINCLWVADRKSVV